MKKLIISGLLPCLLATLSVPAQAADVIFNGNPLDVQPAPITQAGRVFVPLRGVFEALGASVAYENGTINASRHAETVSLHIGSTDADVSGTPQKIDTAPFIVGNSTYVPLRFIAQALGAHVRYDDSSKTVIITQDHDHDGAVQPQPMQPQSMQPGGPPPNSPMIHVVDISPRDGTALRIRRPTIQAKFSDHVNPNDVVILLDGRNVTGDATVTAGGVVYQPNSPLQSMVHEVVIRGRVPHGESFERHWTFSTTSDDVVAP